MTDPQRPSLAAEAISEIRQAVEVFNLEPILPYIEAGYDFTPLMKEPRLRNTLVLMAAQNNLPSLITQAHAATPLLPAEVAIYLHSAANKGQGAMVEHLLALGATLEGFGEFKKHLTIAGAAASGGHVGLLRDYMAQGYHVNLRLDELMTETMRADRGDMLDFMLDNGVPMQDVESAYARFNVRKSMDDPDFSAANANSLPSITDVVIAWRARLWRIDDRHAPAADMDDLRQLTTELNRMTTRLVALAKADRFDEALALAARDRQKLTAADFLVTDAYGNTLLEILGARGRLNDALQARHFDSGLGDILALLPHIAPVYASGTDVQAMVAQHHREQIAARHKKKPFKLGF